MGKSKNNKLTTVTDPVATETNDEACVLKCTPGYGGDLGKTTLILVDILNSEGKLNAHHTTTCNTIVNKCNNCQHHDLYGTACPAGVQIQNGVDTLRNYLATK